MSNIWKWTKPIIAGLLILVLVLTVLTYVVGGFAKSKLVRENPPPGQMVDVGSHQMHLYCTGEGRPTVILESGMNDFYLSWVMVQPEIAKTTRVCSYDRAGLGWSEVSPHPRTSEVMVDELNTLLKNAEVESPYILVGHSFGGIIVRQFASKYSDDVVGIVLVDSAHEEQGVRLPFLKETADQFVGDFRMLSTLSSLGLIALSPGTVPNRGLPDEAYKQYQAVLATTNYFDTASAETASFYRNKHDAPGSLGDLPLVILSHGLPDLTMNLSDSQQSQFEQEWAKMQSELTGLSSNSMQIIAGKSAHYIQLDQPELVIESILELVQASQ